MRPIGKIIGDKDGAGQVVEIIEHEQFGGRAAQWLDKSAIQVDRLTIENNSRARIEVAKVPALAVGNASGRKRVKEDCASPGCKIQAQMLAEARAGAGDDMIGKKFERRAFGEDDVSFLRGRAMQGAIDARGGRGGEASVRAGGKLDVSLENVATKNATGGIEEHGIGRAVVERDGALRLQRKREAAAGENGAGATALEGERKETIAPDAVRIGAMFRTRREVRGESSRPRRRVRCRL